MVNIKRRNAVDMAPAKESTFWKNFDRVKRDWQLYVLLAVPLTFLIIFNYVPMYGVLIAFQRFSPARGVLGSDWVGWDNFIRFFGTPSAVRTINNTLAISIYTLIASMPVPVILAILLNECRSMFFKKSVQMITYAPFFISTVVMVSMLMLFLDPRTGFVNNIIAFFGGERIHFMGERDLFRHVFVWSGIWQGAGFSAVIYIAALSGVDPSLYEASYIDGASRLQKIIHIDLPSLIPTFTILFILGVGQVMNVGFERVFLMQNPANLPVSEVLSTFVYKVGLIQMDFGFAAAVNLFNSIVNCILLVTVNTICRRIGDTSLW